MSRTCISARETPMMAAFAMADTGTVSFLLSPFYKLENPHRNSSQTLTILFPKYNKMEVFHMDKNSSMPLT
jgi:hypothetical protein